MNKLIKSIALSLLFISNLIGATITDTNSYNFTEPIFINNIPVVSSNQLSLSIYSPSNIVSTSSNVLSINNGSLQKLILTNSTTLYLPVIEDSNNVYGIRLELYIGTNIFSLGTNTVLIGTNQVLGSGVSDFISKFYTNRYNSLYFDKSIDQTYFRVFGINL